MDINQLLTDLEKAKLAGVAKDKVLLEAIRKVVLADLYSNGTLKKGLDADPLRNGALSLVAQPQSAMLSDAEVGADLRAFWQGLRALENGLKKLEDFKEEDNKESEETNEAI